MSRSIGNECGVAVDVIRRYASDVSAGGFESNGIRLEDARELRDVRDPRDDRERVRERSSNFFNKSSIF